MELWYEGIMIYTYLLILFDDVCMYTTLYTVIYILYTVIYALHTVKYIIYRLMNIL